MRALRVCAAVGLLSVVAFPALAADPPVCSTVGTKPVPLTSHLPTGEDYPPLSNAMSEGGDSQVSYVVQTDGTTGSVRIVKSSGSLRLDDAAVAFVGKFKFKPALSDGKPTACTNEILVRWVANPTSPEELSALASDAIYPEQADFPPGAFDRKEEGLVVVALGTSSSGVVDQIYLLHGTAFEDLNTATLAVLRKQTIVPPTVNGKTATSFVIVPVMWSMSPKPPALDQNLQVKKPTPMTFPNIPMAPARDH
jgi:TonB family protein